MRGNLPCVPGNFIFKFIISLRQAIRLVIDFCSLDELAKFGGQPCGHSASRSISRLTSHMVLRDSLVVSYQYILRYSTGI